MPSDLDYFYESDLDKTNLKDFYEKLPSSRLQSMFKASLHILIAKGNVLQGYRGPSHMCNGASGDSGVLEEYRGLQEIKFWWAARKDLNFIPLFGTGAYALGRSLQSISNCTNWSSLYFDSQDGELLSHNRDEAEEKLKAKKQAKAEEVISKKLDTLWQQAWDAESDQGEKDRSNEAGRLFDQMLNVSTIFSDVFPSMPRIKQYKTLVSLKTEGNKLYNEGCESQENAVKLFQEAQQLIQQQKYVVANDTFKEAKTRFLQAREKFETGSKSDQRFVDCVNLIQEQVDIVTKSIETTDQQIFSLGLSNLDVNASSHQHTEIEETQVTGTQKNYYQLI